MPIGPYPSWTRFIAVSVCAAAMIGRSRLTDVPVIALVLIVVGFPCITLWAASGSATLWTRGHIEAQPAL